MNNFKLKPTHAPVKAYYETLEKFGRGKFDYEGNIRRAFESLLENCARNFDWFVVGEYQIARTGKSPLRVDAAILDAFNLPRGYWEAKDEKDDLKTEMNDPNREDDPEYIVRLIGQVITVSIETVRLVKELASLPIDQA
jgi:hypothetical protein